MKILWITNTLFPAVSIKLGLPVPHVGGWMFSSAKYLIDVFGEIELGVATAYGGDSYQQLQIDGITYFLLPRSKSVETYDKKLEELWKEVQRDFSPDLVHIHGSEYPHGLAYINGCGNRNVVVSIQGLVSVYERHYFGGISVKTLRKSITLRDRIRKDSVFQQHARMQKRAQYEMELIRKTKHVIGRTSWDRTHTWDINPKVNYHFCNETLRNEFYQHNWDYENCEKHSIFLSQAHYPIKGFQQVLKALPLVLREFPDSVVYVAGNNFFSGVAKWRLNGFGKYIQSLIYKYQLEDKIVFTGVLNEEEMCKRYLKSNLFVCPSSIENSPNSVGEAQLLGVPCVASYVGGTADMILSGETGILYRFEEFEMLADSIIKTFKEKDLALFLSENARKVAFERHSREDNVNQLYSIYNKICNE